MIETTDILKKGEPIYTHEGKWRHVATVLGPLRDYGRKTAHYYEVERHDGTIGVISADYIERRFEGVDAREWYKTDKTVSPAHGLTV